MTDMLPDMRWWNDTKNWLSGLGPRAVSYTFRPTGWNIPNDTDGGITWGGGEEAGVGYMEMDLKDMRHPPRYPMYELRGGYFEIGIGRGGQWLGGDEGESLSSG